ncbi:hypothetical protein H4R34_001067 [Dimargaris verticillata]|uniref:RlpA-like double-psi beta-barrel-protein domain-containing protein-containing protein n=1 Tax=Dimargaris verticillata TaxID=2761393 RepID=A0A9W8B638_9FUNG|nr:hypothetical protein H4R34_001067 [Dimargaris verticillata]
MVSFITVASVLAAATAVAGVPAQNVKTNVHYVTRTAWETTTVAPNAAETTDDSSRSSGSQDSSEYFTGEGTYYNPSVGLGSCGEQHADSDMVVALNAPQYGESANPNNSPACGRKVVITGSKGTTEAIVVDKCPPCKHGDVDMSPAVFDKIGNQADGRVPISWAFLD